MKYDLLFERMLNPGRKSMPDIDIDFAVAGRDRVINYAAEKYGRDRVAQIITFGTMMARAAIRDAGRVLDVPYGTVDRIAKLVPEGPKVYLEDSMKPGQELKAAYDADPLVREILDLAKPLEGLVRQDSIHAAGVVIADRPLTDIVPLQQKGADQELVTQLAMGDVEALGLLKIDFLGLRNLDVIDAAVRLVGDVDIADLPLDDAATYEMLQRGDTAGVFQFESSGMREALRQVKPTEFEDLIALVALFRPGPDVVHPRVRAAQGGPGGGDVRRPAARGDHGLDVRHLHLPGAVHGDREAAGRLLSRRGRRSAQGDRQEDPLAHGLAEGQVRRGRDRERAGGGRRARPLERHGEGAGLLVQQVARSLLRAHRLPHGVPEGTPHGALHGRADLLRHEHEGPRPVLRERVRRDGHRGAPARRERVAGRLRRRRGEDPLRPQRREERRRGGRAGDRRRTRGRGPVRVALGLHRARRPATREQAGARVAREGGRARLDERLAQGHARRPRARALVRPDEAGRPRVRPGVDLRRPARRRRRAEGDVASGDLRPPSSRRRSSCGSRRSRSACTSPSIRCTRFATSCAARPTRASPTSSAAATARS